MKQIIGIVTLVASVCVVSVCAAFIIVSWVVAVDPYGDTIDPRSPPAGIKPGRYSHQSTETETWSNVPINSKENGGTEAASIQRRAENKSTTENTELFDYGTPTRETASAALGLLRRTVEDETQPCEENCPQRAPVPPVRSGPPAPAFIGERAPYWYEKEGQYREADWPGPGDDAEKKGLFARLRERRAGR